MIITKGLIMSASDFHHVVSSYRSNLNVLPYLSDEIKEFYKLSLEIFNIAKEYCYDNSDFVESNINFIQSCLKRMKGLYKKIKSTSYIVSLPYNCKEELLKVCNIEILVCEADISLIETNDKSFISSRMSAVYCIKGLRKNSKIDFSEINEVSSNFASKLIDSYLPDTLLEQNIVASN